MLATVSAWFLLSDIIITFKATFNCGFYVVFLTRLALVLPGYHTFSLNIWNLMHPTFVIRMIHLKSLLSANVLYKSNSLAMPRLMGVYRLNGALLVFELCLFSLNKSFFFFFSQ